MTNINRTGDRTNQDRLNSRKFFSFHSEAANGLLGSLSAMLSGIGSTRVAFKQVPDDDFPVCDEVKHPLVTITALQDYLQSESTLSYDILYKTSYALDLDRIVKPRAEDEPLAMSDEKTVQRLALARCLESYQSKLTELASCLNTLLAYLYDPNPNSYNTVIRDTKRITAYTIHLYMIDAEIKDLCKQLSGASDQDGSDSIWTNGVQRVVGQLVDDVRDYVDGLQYVPLPKFDKVNLVKEFKEQFKGSPKDLQNAFRSLSGASLEQVIPKLSAAEIAVVAEKLSLNDLKLLLAYVENIQYEEHHEVVRHAVSLQESPGSQEEIDTYNIPSEQLLVLKSISPQALNILQAKGFSCLTQSQKLKEILLDINVHGHELMHEFAQIVLIVTEYQAVISNYQLFLQDGVDHIQHPSLTLKKALQTIDAFAAKDTLSTSPLNYEIENPNLLLASISGSGNCQTVAKIAYFQLLRKDPDNITFKGESINYANSETIAHIYLQEMRSENPDNWQYFKIDPERQAVAAFEIALNASQQILYSFLMVDQYILEAEEYSQVKRSKPAFNIQTPAGDSTSSVGSFHMEDFLGKVLKKTLDPTNCLTNQSESSQPGAKQGLEETSQAEVSSSQGSSASHLGAANSSLVSKILRLPQVTLHAACLFGAVGASALLPALISSNSTSNQPAPVVQRDTFVTVKNPFQVLSQKQLQELFTLDSQEIVQRYPIHADQQTNNTYIQTIKYLKGLNLAQLDKQELAICKKILEKLNLDVYQPGYRNDLLITLINLLESMRTPASQNKLALNLN